MARMVHRTCLRAASKSARADYPEQLFMTKPVTLEGVFGDATPRPALVLSASGGLIVDVNVVARRMRSTH